MIKPFTFGLDRCWPGQKRTPDREGEFPFGVVWQFPLFPNHVLTQPPDPNHDRSTQVHLCYRCRDRDGCTRRLLAGNIGTGTDALRVGLRELGYAEGRAAIIEWRWWEGKPERLRDAAAEMVRLNPDVIVVGGSEAARP